jgi:hypothetical protein
MKMWKMWIRCMTESQELQSELPMECLSISGKKLNIVLICVMPLMVPIFRYIDTRNFVRSDAWKCINFSNKLHGWRYIMFYLLLFRARHPYITCLKYVIIFNYWKP